MATKDLLRSQKEKKPNGWIENRSGVTGPKLLLSAKGLLDYIGNNFTVQID
jgi:hypothetical protein